MFSFQARHCLFSKESGMESKIIDKEVIPFNDQKVVNGLFIMAVSHIPPHIGWICNNHYYSYSTRGVIIKLPLKDQIRKVALINIPSVIIDLSNEIGEDASKSCFQNLGVLGYGDSCLRPINQLLDQDVDLMLFELMEKIEDKILKVYDINAGIKGHLSIPVYSKEVVNANIEKHLGLVENK